MAEPSRRASRLTIAGAMLALIGAGAAGFALGRSTAEPTPPPPARTATPPPPAPSPAPAPVLPTVQLPLGRAELIAAAARAADAFASGGPLPAGVAGLAGREFELRLPFGCPGGQPASAAALTASYDEAAGALRVRAEPVRWAPEAWSPEAEAATEGSAAVEGIEGFWIARPWTSSEACPAPASAPAQPASAPEQTLGIAQFFTDEGSRVGRRDGEAYEAVEKVAPEALDLRRGLRLRLRGKLARAPGGGPVVCRARSGARPVCLLSVTIDEVAVENPATGTMLATWDVASQAGVNASGSFD